MINKLRELNPQIQFFSVNDNEFKNYGRKIEYDSKDIVKTAKNVSMPDKGAFYEPSINILEKEKSFEDLSIMLMGGLKCQAGMVRGYNSYLNALEYHNSSEINVAITPVVLLLGLRCEMDGDNFDSSNIKAFYLEEGDVVEVLATTLHFTPCQVNDNGFGAIVMLPKGTNELLDGKKGDRLLFKNNKWVICHKDNNALIEKGVYPGISGENYQIKYN